MLSFGFFVDPALTTPIVSSPQFVQFDTAPSPVDKIIWFGARDPARVCLPAAGGQIVLSVDSTPGNVFMALSKAGLDSAAAGAPLSLGNEVMGGLDGAVAIHVRVLDVSHAVGSRLVSFSTNLLNEFSI